MAAGGRSQAGAYGALIAGGVLAVAGFTGHSFKDVLAGKSSPLRGLISTPPEGGEGANLLASLLRGGNEGTAGTGGKGSTGGHTAGTSGSVAGGIEWAESVIGVSGGSGKVARWDAAIGQAPGIPWCSAFVAAVLRHAGVKNMPGNPAYSGAWLNWSGGVNLQTTNLGAAKPGDLLIFDWGDGGITDHVAYYLGHNQMLSGNDSNDSVGKSSVPSGNIVGIVRPKYPVQHRGTSNSTGFRITRA